MQRFWLTATRLGLQLQPELTPLIFSRYHRTRLPFSRTDGMMDDAGRIAVALDAEFGADTARSAVFMGRVGAGPAAKARSLRLPIESLMIPSRSATANDQKLKRVSA